jgi:hypothetical protein
MLAARSGITMDELFDATASVTAGQSSMGFIGPLLHTSPIPREEVIKPRLVGGAGRLLSFRSGSLALVHPLILREMLRARCN